MNPKIEKMHEQLEQKIQGRTGIKPHLYAEITQELSATTNDILQELYTHQIELELQNEELQLAQEEWVDSRNRYLDLYDFSPVGYLTLTAQGLITEINLTAATLLSETRNDLFHRRFSQFVTPEDNDRWYLFFNAAMKHGERQECELTICRRVDDTRLNMHLDCRYIKSKGDEPPMLRLTLTDVSALKKTEQLLIVARNQAETFNQAKSEFLANMSHEIRSPLNAIISASYLCGKTELTPNQRELLRKIDFSANILRDVIDPILDFSKIEAGKLILETVNFSLDELLAHVIAFNELTAANKGISLVLSVAFDTPKMLIGDLTRLTQILTNLVNNAVKFTDKGSVIITVKPKSFADDYTELCFSVQDSGIGMTDEQAANLFESFTQADNSITRKYGGTGLGLSISKQLVTLMDGRIWIEKSALNEGSLFIFTVNLGIAPVEPEIIDDTFIPQEVSVCLTMSASLIGRRILLVEDNAINRELMIELLTSFGMVVVCATNGLEGVARVKAEPFDMVLMDLQMPIMDGLTATREIRKDAYFAELPIIALTASGLISDREKSIAAGLNDHLTKPIHPDKLKATLCYWLHSSLPLPVEMAREFGAPISELLPATLPPFDLSVALERVNHNEDLLYKMLLMLQARYHDVIPQLQTLIAANQIKEAHRLTHTLKDVVGILAATPLYHAVLAVEQALQNGIDGSECDFLITVLNTELSTALAAVATLKVELPDVAPLSNDDFK